MGTDNDRCRGCSVAAQVVAETGCAYSCTECGEQWTPRECYRDEERGARADRTREPPYSAERDLEQLARYLPLLTGRALGITFATYTHDDQALVVGDGNRGGASIGARSGRSDAVDERHRELRRALRALARLQALSRAGDALSSEVLWYLYVHCGPELRKMHKGGPHDLVATRFAHPRTLAGWRGGKSRVVASRMPGRFGEALLVCAERAYESGVPHARRLTDRDPDALAREQVIRAGRDVDLPAEPADPAKSAAEAVDPAKSAAHGEFLDGPRCAR